MNYTKLLQGKNALITSGAHGMGFAIAELFVRHGATVAICGRQASGEHSAAYLRKIAPKSFFRKTDMSLQEEVEAFCDEALERLGHIDIVVNNVGINTLEPSFEITPEIYEYIQSVNIKSVVTINRKILPGMIERGQGGALVHISSVHSTATGPTFGSYAVTKGGMNAFSRVMATELGRFGIRSNVVCPGDVFTTYQAIDWNELDEVARVQYLQDVALYTPVPSPGHAEDIAHACLFFCSDMGAYTTGATIMADGGESEQLHRIEAFPQPLDYDAFLGEYAKSFMTQDEADARYR